jgi:hypothetical protein
MLATEMFSNVGIWAFNHAALETSELSPDYTLNKLDF